VDGSWREVRNVIIEFINIILALGRGGCVRRERTGLDALGLCSE
jgi:hypothetical protein